MKIGKFEIIIVCANFDKEIGGYGDIYDSLYDCIEEHPDDEVIFGYCILCEDDNIETPDWFDTIEEAISWVKLFSLNEECSTDKKRTLEEKIEFMNNMKKNTIDDKYDKGFYNGIEYCLSLLEDREASYKSVSNNTSSVVKNVLEKELSFLSKGKIDIVTREIVKVINN